MSEPIPMVTLRCPDCESDKVVSRLAPDVFPYGEPGPAQVQLASEAVVRRCEACEFEWTDWVTEAIREMAVTVWKEKDEP